MSVYENVAFGLKIAGIPAAEIAGEVEKALKLVRLGEMGQRMPGELSGGQQQRVASPVPLSTNPAYCFWTNHVRS